MRKKHLLPAFLAIASITGTGETLQAQTTVGLRNLHSFGDTAGNGANPMGTLLQGTNGAIYGTTFRGGNSANTGGVIFRITRDGTYSVLSAPGFTAPTTDVTFTGGLIQAADGNFYGTTYGTGFGAGTVFRVKPDGTFTTLHNLALAEGLTPRAALVEGPDGALYGTTSDGGPNGLFHGTIFRITTGGDFTVLQSFDAGNSGCYAPLINGEDGSFYGTTVGFGLNAGTVFRITTDGVLTTLHTFNAQTDGLFQPQSALLKVADGLYYGTADSSGDSSGGIFSITSDGVYTTLYRFPLTASGEVLTPSALIKGADGAYYGTTFSGGTGNAGSVFRFAVAGGAVSVTTLYDFVSNQAGANPNGPLIQTSSGDFYGVTNNGGANGVGTIFTSEGASPGTLQFNVGTYDTTESSGSVTLTVSRTGGSVGAASVSYATVNGTAVAGTDYTAVSGTLTWADGDNTAKTITVAIIDQGLVDAGTHTFTVALSGASVVSLGSPGSAAVNIALNDTARPTQPTIGVSNPPEGIHLVAGSTVPLRADVTDTAGILVKVEFFLNGVLYTQFEPGGPYVVRTADLAPGNYALRVVATDTFGRTSEATRTFVIVADDTANPTPGTAFFGDYDGRLFFGGTFLTLTATADTFGFDASLLAQIAFYYNGILIAAYDSQGNLLPGGLAGLEQYANGLFGSARFADAGNLAALFRARFQVPGVEGLINLTTVVTSRSGISRVSNEIILRSTISGVNGVTAAVISGIADGSTVMLGTPLTFTVDVTGLVSLVEYYVNGIKAGSGTTAPFTFEVPTPRSGSYVLSALVTDGNGLATSTVPLTVQAAAPVPTVSFVIPGANGGHSTAAAEGTTLKLRLVRSGEDFSEGLVVNYKVKGNATAGRDYRILSGTATIPAGQSGVKVKVRFPTDDVRDGTHILKLKLLPSADGTYEIGRPLQAKVRILDAN